MTDKSTGRDATDAELEQAKKDATKMIESMAVSMRGRNIAEVFAALGIVVTRSFQVNIKTPARLRAFDEFASAIRSNLQIGVQ